MTPGDAAPQPGKPVARTLDLPGAPTPDLAGARTMDLAGARTPALPGARTAGLPLSRTAGLPLSLADVEAAAARIAGRVHHTPVLTSRLLDAALGCRVFLKAEHLQRVGAFKARGAANAVWALDPETRARGVIAVSSGNHAQAVALAAAEAGIPAVVVMPEDSNPAKLAATRAYGAEVVSQGVTHERRDQVVRELAAERSLHLIHPYDDPAVMAGQGTAALELLDEVGDLDLVCVPVGGGGLIAGTATAVKGRSPGTRVVGVEPAAAADTRASLAAGRRVALPAAPVTIADGVRALTPGEHTFPVVQRLVDEVVTVTDAELLDALALVWSRTKQLVEPSAALPLAALATGAVTGRRVGVILSGGNVDAAALAAALGQHTEP
ncbi:MAG TPA: threonine/serine dehydratase [Actinomycetes bacterium]|nr:threonine/serine dehydratase [Actinomycetes bacterium]